MTRHITLGEFFWLAEQVTGIDADVLAKASRSDLADSALHAPQAGFGEEEFYPDVYDKAAVLVCGSPGTIHSLMETSVPHGPALSCTST